MMRYVTMESLKQVPVDSAPPDLDMDGVIQIDELAVLLRTTRKTILRRVSEGTFPLPPLEGIDKRLRWWGPTVRQWLEKHAPAAPNGRRRRRRSRQP